MQKLKLGITGGMGCGQSLTARLLQDQYGAVVISMDQAGRNAVQEHAKVRAQLRRAFGDEYFDDAGHLQRARMAQLIFSDETQRHTLNEIVHPVMLQIVWEELAAAMRRPSRAPYVVLDAALLFELGVERGMDKVVAVTAPLPLRLQRIMTRDGLSPQQAQQRIAGQWPIEEKVRRADYVIENNATVAALTKKVRQLHRWLMEQCDHR